MPPVAAVVLMALQPLAAAALKARQPLDAARHSLLSLILFYLHAGTLFYLSRFFI